MTANALIESVARSAKRGLERNLGICSFTSIRAGASIVLLACAVFAPPISADEPRYTLAIHIIPPATLNESAGNLLKNALFNKLEQGLETRLKFSVERARGDSLPKAVPGGLQTTALRSMALALRRATVRGANARRFLLVVEVNPFEPDFLVQWGLIDIDDFDAFKPRVNPFSIDRPDPERITQRLKRRFRVVVNEIDPRTEVLISCFLPRPNETEIVIEISNNLPMKIYTHLYEEGILPEDYVPILPLLEHLQEYCNKRHNPYFFYRDDSDYSADMYLEGKVFKKRQAAATITVSVDVHMEDNTTHPFGILRHAENESDTLSNAVARLLQENWTDRIAEFRPNVIAQ
jgi:hypothetical protein